MGIPLELLDSPALHRLEPALGPRAVAGALYGSGAHISDPLLLTLALAKAALERQAHLVRGRVVAVSPGASGVTLQFSDGGAVQADLAVLAAGAWSRPLAGSAGDRVPLDMERGYNVSLPPGRLGLSRPAVFEGEGFVTTPLDTGDRVGGAVEFAGLRVPPNFARVDAILSRLRRYLPDADLSGSERWVGFRPSLPDSLPVIGRSPGNPHLIYAFGHAHYGLTQAAATAELVAALVAGECPAIDVAPFRPGRFG